MMANIFASSLSDFPPLRTGKIRPYPEEQSPMSKFLAINRDVPFLFPPSVQEWLPENHLARYIANVV